MWKVPLKFSIQVLWERTDTGLEQQSGAHHAVSAESKPLDRGSAAK
jgi:hypothetical protein